MIMRARYDTLMATSALLIATNSAATLMTTHHLALQLTTAALRLAAVIVLWQTLPRAVHDPRGWLPVAAYFAGLFALFGDRSRGERYSQPLPRRHY